MQTSGGLRKSNKRVQHTGSGTEENHFDEVTTGCSCTAGDGGATGSAPDGAVFFDPSFRSKLMLMLTRLRTCWTRLPKLPIPWLMLCSVRTASSPDSGSFKILSARCFACPSLVCKFSRILFTTTSLSLLASIAAATTFCSWPDRLLISERIVSACSRNFPLVSAGCPSDRESPSCTDGFGCLIRSWNALPIPFKTSRMFSFGFSGTSEIRTGDCPLLLTLLSSLTASSRDSAA